MSTSSISTAGGSNIANPELARFQAPRFARRFVRISGRMEDHGMAELRDEQLAGLRGSVLEVGCGDGRNFRHYPAAVRVVRAVEPEDVLRGHAQRAAAGVPTPIEVVPGHATALPADDSSYDAVVFTLVLCSVPDPCAALEEAYRVLRPRGEVRFCEHVRAQNPLGAALQGAVTPLTRRMDAGCHQNRDTARTLETSSLEVSRVRRLGFKVVPGLPGLPMIIGSATRPDRTR